MLLMHIPAQHSAPPSIIPRPHISRSKTYHADQSGATVRTEDTHGTMRLTHALTADGVALVLGLAAVLLEVAESGGGHVAPAHAGGRGRRLARAHVVLARRARRALLRGALGGVARLCKIKGGTK